LYTRFAIGVALCVAAAIAVGFAFAGSADTLPAGTKIAGVDVGGMTTQRARAELERRAAALKRVPVTFVSAGRSWRIRPVELGVSSDWRAAIEAARRDGDGFAFVRGYRRLALRFGSPSLTPKAKVYRAALAYEIGVLAAAIDRPARDARLTRRGLRFEVEPGQTGTVLDRPVASRRIVRALASLDRTKVPLAVRTQHPKVSAVDLRAAAALDRRVVSAPVALVLEGKRRSVSRWQLASMLVLQDERGDKLELGGRAASTFFLRLHRDVSRPPKNATFEVDSGRVTVIPARPGLALDVPRTMDAVLAAARRRTNRVAPLSVVKTQPERSTAAARAMGITGIVGTYETVYGGVANRIHNVQLVAHLVDNKLIAPGATFSFNDTTGERTAEKGFLEAPVIINGELQTGLGGGVCQVSTTVFNAAYEAGLSITSRTNHALYISHYPLGRDATVNYPDTDLKFVNDTPRWLLLRTFVGSSSLVVALYGTPQNRRVESETAPLKELSPAPVIRIVDKSLQPGEVVVDEAGAPARATSVRRHVYDAGGKLMYDTTWYSSYRSEAEVIRVGPKKKKPVKPVKSAKPDAADAADAVAADETAAVSASPVAAKPLP
jgi:vancomycin resistance protein YoaR